MKNSLSMRVTPQQAQTVKVSPQLQHAVRLLQMSSQGFAQALLASLGRNSFLDSDDDSSPLQGGYGHAARDREQHGQHLSFVLATGCAENNPPASVHFMHLRKLFTLEALARILDLASPQLAQPAPSADFVRTSSGSGLTAPKPGDES